MSPTVVFFDGVCNLCNGFVDWLIRMDKHGRLKFASLQGRAAGELLGPEADGLASIVVVREGQLYRESDAILVIGESLGGIHAFFAKLSALLPRRLRDAIYRFVAKRRYRIFGKRDTCRVPTAEERKRFLD